MPPALAADSAQRFWRRTALSRLKFELAGLAFALQKGSDAGEYARYLWGKGAIPWMGKRRPEAGEYLLKESEAFRCLYPGVAFQVIEAGPEKAELLFTGGCLGGWGKEPWALARSLGLKKRDVCAYCRESFRAWSAQLGLDAGTEPEDNGTCRLRVVKH